MIERLKGIFENKSIALLGFGREGQSTYKLFRKAFPIKTLTILDANPEIRKNIAFKNDLNLQFITGHKCMQYIDSFEIAIKSPGIPSNSLPTDLKNVNITSQTDIFLQLFANQVIGITGTKGKSTTSSLVHHILTKAGINSLFVGNIGIPPFECINDIRPESIIVMELSSHQLEYISHSPHIAILLNLFQEHLDHYKNYKEYQLAKLNIAKFQKPEDYFIYNSDNKTIKLILEELSTFTHTKLPFSLNSDSDSAIRINNQFIEIYINNEPAKLYDTSQGQPLAGNHNLYNIMAAAAACYLNGVSVDFITSGIKSFSGLEHRIEPVGEHAGIQWYNDSIATIPEATIEAVKTLKSVDTLILGGFDRGIDYSVLYPFLLSSGIRNIIFIGEAGRRMKKELTKHDPDNLNIYSASNYDEVISKAIHYTKKGKICLLSPAAASYDMFRNFEERGNAYKRIVREQRPSQE